MRALRGLERADGNDLAVVVAHQRAAYTPNRAIMGVEPLPLLADYAEIFATHEVWLSRRDGELEGVLILQLRADDLYIWSVATAPAAQGAGVGNHMLGAAADRAAALERRRLRLRTGEKLARNVTWYQRHGFVIESIEQLADRRVVHMCKELG